MQTFTAAELPRTSPRPLLLHGFAIFLSATLLFLLQPMFAKSILPWFGGSAGVWAMSMVFFQTVLLLGYLYAHAITRLFAPSRQVLVHLAVAAATLFFLPVEPWESWRPAGEHRPMLSIAGVLAVSIGLPYLLLSTTGPLIQYWYAAGGRGPVPYRLFAVSNAGSLLALLCYPFLIEPALPLKIQMAGWSAAYLAFLALLAACAISAARTTIVSRQNEGRPARANVLREYAAWIALAACPSALWMSVASYLSQDVAPVPFLWVVPLSIYLLTFVLCFDRAGWYNPRIFRWVLPAAWLAMVISLSRQGTRTAWSVSLWALPAALFVCCMFCHGELARRKPEPARLTSFYLALASGGAAGGLFVGVLAPLLFATYLELPAAIAGCVILALALLYGYSSRNQLLRLGLASAAAFTFALQVPAFLGSSQLLERNFYGALKVLASGSGDGAARELFSGTVLHGVQFISPAFSRLPTAYYAPWSGAGLSIGLSPKTSRRVGVIGLGVGTLAAFGRPDDTYRFYEINPLVVDIARRHFLFLNQSAARIEIAVGDARLLLERESPQNFDVLMVDAFSGDSIPVHLLTREAFDLYFRHLKPEGALAVHATNKYLDLAPVIAKAAAAAGSNPAGRKVMLIQSPADHPRRVYAARWVVITSNRQLIEKLEPAALPIAEKPSLAAWTDDYSNLFRLLK